ncbi:hypothetical protein [Natronococcus pandeyae]|uniref:hypothetical protein n=1 Tax=Natronococcus pandeyae TaxID=2055836 RepID=UPI0016531EE5|nr:hypothetical protein [Natronococcus pandeyae]
MADTSDPADAPVRAPSGHSEVRTSRLADGNWLVASVPDGEPISESEDRRDRDSSGGS